MVELWKIEHKNNQINIPNLLAEAANGPLISKNYILFEADISMLNMCLKKIKVK